MLFIGEGKYSDGTVRAGALAERGEQSGHEC